MNAPVTQRLAKKSPPTERDLQIFKLAEIQRWTHDQIADHYGDISRRRVSQIVQEVRHWLAHHPTEDPQLNSELEQRRLTRNVERMHLENVITRALFALDHAPPTLQTTCHANGVCVANYHRDQPPVDVRVLKTYLRAVEALGKLNERPEIPEPELPPGTAADDVIPWQDPRLTKIFNYWAGCYGMPEDAMRKMTKELTCALFDIFNLATADQADDSAEVDKLDEAKGSPSVNVGPPVPDGPERLNAQPSASDVSQREAPDLVPPAPEAQDPIPCDPITYSDIVAARALDQILGPFPQKSEKGSADDDSDAPPAPAPLPVMEVHVTADKPGATVVAPSIGPSAVAGGHGTQPHSILPYVTADVESLAGPQGRPSSAQGG
jgi:hypothetical protein